MGLWGTGWTETRDHTRGLWGGQGETQTRYGDSGDQGEGETYGTGTLGVRMDGETIDDTR